MDPSKFVVMKYFVEDILTRFEVSMPLHFPVTS